MPNLDLPYQWTALGFLLALTAGCVDDSSSSSDAGGGFSSSSGGTPAASSAGSSSSGGEATAAGGSASSSSGGSSAVGVLGSLPAPTTSDVPQPSADVDTPNLVILPWAGFAAAVSYTFDDTQPSQAEHWEELVATGAPMTFFCNPSANWQSGFDATWTAVAAAGNEIGNHTWSHCNSTLTSDGCTPIGTAEEELDEANTYIVEHFGVTAVRSFASPFGDSGWNTHASSRFLVGRGVMSGMVPARGVTDWYNLPVFPVTEGQTSAAFNASIDSARSSGRWDIFMVHSLLPTTNDWFAGVETSDITASVAYAQSLGDVWIDTMGAVGAYARAQQTFEALTPSDDTWTWTLPDHFPAGGVLRVTVDGGSLSQNGMTLAWDPHGYYEVALDAGTLSWSP